MVDHNEICGQGTFACLHDKALFKLGAIRSQAVFTGGGDVLPDRCMLRYFIQTTFVAMTAVGGIAFDLRQIVCILTAGKENLIGCERVFEMVMTDIIRSTFQQRK